MLASVNQITIPNVPQHLKTIQRFTAFFLSVIHLLAKTFVDNGIETLKEFAPAIQYGRLRHMKGLCAQHQSWVQRIYYLCLEGPKNNAN